MTFELKRFANHETRDGTGMRRRPTLIDYTQTLTLRRGESGGRRLPGAANASVDAPANYTLHYV
jgi:hypothetical protein